MHEYYSPSGIQDLAPPIEVVHHHTGHARARDETHAPAHTRGFSASEAGSGL